MQNTDNHVSGIHWKEETQEVQQLAEEATVALENQEQTESVEENTAKEVKAKQPKDTQPKTLEGSELADEEIFQVVSAENVEEAISGQITNVEIDVEVPKGDLLKLTKLRDNARQAYKENETRFKRTLEEMEEVQVRRDKDPDDASLKEYQIEIDVAVAKYVSKMRRYLKRYEVARSEILAIREAEEAAKKAKEAEAQPEESK
jgi:hypothetical protein